MSIRPQWAFLSSIAILLLLVAPVSAAPSLSLGSQASYTLNGSLKANQSCTAVPAQYTAQACGFYVPPPPNRTFQVRWVDNATCSASSTACRFDPTILSIPTGSSVQWSHSGSLTHTATSNNTANGNLPSFDSGAVPAGSTYTHNFSVPGTYQYYCLIHPWMKAVVNAVGIPIPPPTPPPTSSSIQVDFNGNIATNVIALSGDVANLKVDHSISVSVSPIPGITFTPVTERGSFEQKITLSTRVESPGTATSIIQSLLRSIPPLYGQPRYITPVSYNPQFNYTGPPTPLATSISPSPLSSMLPLLTPNNGDPVTTMWWVNGPLSLGSPVQILTGSSSVTGDENLNLGTTLGTRSAWLVTSQFSQSINATSPPPTSSQSSASFRLNLLFSFDKKGDLLLRSSAAASAATMSVTNQQIITGNSCGPQPWCTFTFAQATVTRTMNTELNLALRLSSTNLNLDRRMNTSTSPSALLEIMASLPWLPVGGAGAGAAGIVGASIWYTQARKKPVQTSTASHAS